MGTVVSDWNSLNPDHLNIEPHHHIFGIGTDIVAIERFKKILARHPTRICEKILSHQEITLFGASKQPSHFLAKRWATKEAFVKALGTGFRDGILMTDCETQHDELGKPSLNIRGKSAKKMATLGIKHCHLSVSDENDYAIAFVILTR